jgi:hypothetical protein
MLKVSCVAAFFIVEVRPALTGPDSRTGPLVSFVRWGPAFGPCLSLVKRARYLCMVVPDGACHTCETGLVVGKVSGACPKHNACSHGTNRARSAARSTWFYRTALERMAKWSPLSTNPLILLERVAFKLTCIRRLPGSSRIPAVRWHRGF